MGSVCNAAMICVLRPRAARNVVWPSMPQVVGLCPDEQSPYPNQGSARQDRYPDQANCSQVLDGMTSFATKALHPNRPKCWDGPHETNGVPRFIGPQLLASSPGRTSSYSSEASAHTPLVGPRATEVRRFDLPDRARRAVRTRLNTT